MNTVQPELVLGRLDLGMAPRELVVGRLDLGMAPRELASGQPRPEKGRSLL